MGTPTLEGTIRDRIPNERIRQMIEGKRITRNSRHKVEVGGTRSRNKSREMDKTILDWKLGYKSTQRGRYRTKCVDT